MSKLLVFDTHNKFGVLEQTDSLTSFFVPGFSDRSEAALFQAWLGRWRETCDFWPDEDAQLCAAVMIHLFLEPILGIDVHDVMSEKELLDAFLESSYGKTLGRKVAA